ncbi:MAG: methyltransferase domain-containing protein [Lentisphaerae bacterium]|jgi:SAM-dependent methyltransferase|nr:methyltransferase domain-containing protein [Lentisphaerota bacterium]
MQPNASRSATAAAPLDAGGIVALASAYYGSATLFAALDCGLFGQLAKTPDATAAAIAAALQLDPHGTRLLLDGCVALGLIEKNGDTYRNTPAAAATLVPGAAHDLTRAIRYNQDVYGAWGQLAKRVRTGCPVEAPSIHLGEDTERTRRFVHAMHGRALGIGRAVVPLLELEGARRLLDVGGGPGTYAMLMARAHEGLHATVLDLPGIVAVAHELIAAANMEQRVATLPGDYHTTPFDGPWDAITFFGVLHQEPPDTIACLMRSAYAALAPGGRIFVLDLMTDDTHAHPPFAALFALNMSLSTEHGWVFSEGEMAGWLTAAGFEGVKSRPAPPPMPHVLMTARKP